MIFVLEQISKVAHWLTPANSSAQQSDIIAKRQDGTGLWLLNSEEYKLWIQEKKQTLFCPGIPGGGKTMTSAIVVDDIRKTFYGHDRIGIACLFCSYKRQSEQRWADLLASLLKQLVQELPSLPDVVESLYNEHTRRNTCPSSNELLNVLRSVVGSYSRVFFVIDALDECTNAEGDRTHLLHEIFRLQGHTGINLFATSRFIPEIEKEFEGCMKLEIRANDDDVLRYLDGKMLQLRAFVSRNFILQEEIKSKIIEAVDGMYVLGFSIN